MEDVSQTTNLQLITFVAILPAFLLVYYIYIKDKYQREPLSQIVRGVAFGVISALLALGLEIAINWIVGSYPESMAGAFLKAFISAAIPEEAAKLTMLYLLLRNNSYFDERFDGIVYAVCIGMGFAATENIVYLLGNINFWKSVAVSRAIFAVPAHFMFAVAMGYFYSKLYFDKASLKTALSVFVAPVILHGIYDGILFTTNIGSMSAYMFILLSLFYVFCFWMYKLSKKRIEKHLQRDWAEPIKFENNEENNL